MTGKPLSDDEIKLVRQGVILVRGEKYTVEWFYELAAAVAQATGSECLTKEQLDAIWEDAIKNNE